MQPREQGQSSTRLSHTTGARALLNPGVSQSAAVQQATSGRQVRTGFRQSIPSSI
jgi:hypothetical protein